MSTLSQDVTYRFAQRSHDKLFKPLPGCERRSARTKEPLHLRSRALTLHGCYYKLPHSSRQAALGDFRNADVAFVLCGQPAVNFRPFLIGNDILQNPARASCFDVHKRLISALAFWVRAIEGERAFNFLVLKSLATQGVVDPVQPVLAGVQGLVKINDRVAAFLPDKSAVEHDRLTDQSQQRLSPTARNAGHPFHLFTE